MRKVNGEWESKWVKLVLFFILFISCKPIYRLLMFGNNERVVRFSTSIFVSLSSSNSNIVLEPYRS